MADKKDRREFNEEMYNMLLDIHQVIYGNGDIRKSLIHRLSKIETTLTFIVATASMVGGIIGSLVTIFTKHLIA